MDSTFLRKTHKDEIWEHMRGNMGSLDEIRKTAETEPTLIEKIRLMAGERKKLGIQIRLGDGSFLLVEVLGFGQDYVEVFDKSANAVLLINGDQIASVRDVTDSPTHKVGEV